MKSGELFQMLAQRYREESDDFPLSVGAFRLHGELSLYNQPEFEAYMRLEMRDIRSLAENGETAA